MHLIYFVETLVDLLNSDYSLILLVNYPKNRLVLLFVYCELFLHFERRVRQEACWRRLRLLLRLGQVYRGTLV